MAARYHRGRSQSVDRHADLIRPSRWSVWIGDTRWCRNVQNDILYPGRVKAANRLFGVENVPPFTVVGIGTSDAPTVHSTADLSEPLFLDATHLLRVTGSVTADGGQVSITAIFDASTHLAPAILSTGASHSKQLREAGLFSALSGVPALYRVVFPTPLPISGSNSITVVVGIVV